MVLAKLIFLITKPQQIFYFRELTFEVQNARFCLARSRCYSKLFEICSNSIRVSFRFVPRYFSISSSFSTGIIIQLNQSRHSKNNTGVTSNTASW